MIGAKTETGDGGKGDGGGAGQQEGRQWRGRKTAFQVEGRCSGSETKVKLVNKTRVGRVEVRKEWGKGHHMKQILFGRPLQRGNLLRAGKVIMGTWGVILYMLCFLFKYSQRKVFETSSTLVTQLCHMINKCLYSKVCLLVLTFLC